MSPTVLILASFRKNFAKPINLGKKCLKLCEMAFFKRKGVVKVTFFLKIRNAPRDNCYGVKTEIGSQQSIE